MMLSKSSPGSTSKKSSSRRAGHPARVSQAGQLLLGVCLHLGVGLGLEHRLGLGDVLGDLLVFEVGLDRLGERCRAPWPAAV